MGVGFGPPFLRVSAGVESGHGRPEGRAFVWRLTGHNEHDWVINRSGAHVKAVRARNTATSSSQHADDDGG